MRVYFIVIQLILLMLLLRAYFIAPDDGSPLFINEVLIYVLILLLSTNLCDRKLRGNMFSIKNIFLFSFCIVYFQAPLDYVLGYDVNTEWFYDFKIFCPSLVFSALFLQLFIIGYYCISIGNNYENKNLVKKGNFLFSGISLFSVLGWSFLLFFIQREGIGFFNGGYGAANDGTTISDPYSLRWFNYLVLCLQLVVLMIVWNANSKKQYFSLVEYLKLFPLSFLILYFAVIILWFCAGGRAISLELSFFFLYGYIMLSNFKVSFIPFLILLYIGGLFLSFLKGMGGLLGGDRDFLEAFSGHLDYFLSNTIERSLFPPTCELSFSIFINNFLYSLWLEEHYFYGIPILIGLIRGIPGGIALISLVFGIDISNYNLPAIAQEMMNMEKGPGNSCVAEILVSLGWGLTLLLAFIFGFLFRKLDLLVICKRNTNLFFFILGFSFFSQAFFIPRGSFFSAVSQSLFIYIILILYKRFFSVKI